ncbi:ATP-binding cassette domain-containing protein [Arthrobacter sp. NPDC093128]|uniref:ATP-binding cassette domain-containing protein n=1 Tax=Arthrobacter sp. NPDC093128 TaxID=3154979 RepID=UPI00342A295D
MRTADAHVEEAPTGAGKTTLVNLMMRFYEIDAGRISLDGVDVTSVARYAGSCRRPASPCARRLLWYQG